MDFFFYDPPLLLLNSKKKSAHFFFKKEWEGERRNLGTKKKMNKKFEKSYRIKRILKKEKENKA